MNVFAIGDVHGCVHTFKALVEKAWNTENSFLVQVGDLILKGPHSGSCIQYAMKLEKEYPYQAFFLMGNHEWLFIKEMKADKRQERVLSVLRQTRGLGIADDKLLDWLEKRPLVWKTPQVLISHAGRGKKVLKPEQKDHPQGYLMNRGPLSALKKTQILGHIVQEQGRPLFKTSVNAWYIDTGAWLGQGLTGITINDLGEVTERNYEQTHPADLIVQ